MRLLFFISALGILLSIAVLIIVIIKANRDTDKGKDNQGPKDKD